MRVSRVFGVLWGLLIVLMSGAMLVWIPYSLFFSDEPSRFPWWWGCILFVVWSFGLVVGVSRIRGKPITFFGTPRTPPSKGSWSSSACPACGFEVREYVDVCPKCGRARGSGRVA
ncbi:MAG: hypothetical protein HZA53_11120 [Planctomycetes bacterium]|nr:hypothetical protein [Planctomycetota bacterium]